MYYFLFLKRVREVKFFFFVDVSDIVIIMILCRRGVVRVFKVGLVVGTIFRSFVFFF